MCELGSHNCPEKKKNHNRYFYAKSQSEMLQFKLTTFFWFLPPHHIHTYRWTFTFMESEKSLPYDIVLLQLPGSPELFPMAVTSLCSRQCSQTMWPPAAPGKPPCHGCSPEWLPLLTLTCMSRPDSLGRSLQGMCVFLPSHEDYFSCTSQHKVFTQPSAEVICCTPIQKQA